MSNDSCYASLAGKILLYDSKVCRLCGEENENGLPLFRNSEGKKDCELSQLINRYLPLKVHDDGISPRWICPGCNIQLDSTAQFFEMIIKGQQLVEALLFREIEWEEQRQRASASKSSAAVEDLEPLYDTLDQAKWNELFEKAEMAPTGSGTDLLPIELHELEDLLKPDSNAKEHTDLVPATEEPMDAPSGADAEKDWIVKSDMSKTNGRLIGFVQNRNATDIGSLVVVARTEGSKRTQAQFVCDICSKLFPQELQYLRHRKIHSILFECFDCLLKFGTSDKLEIHQQETSHQGRGMVEGLQFADEKQTTARKAAERQPAKVDRDLYACDSCDNTFPELTTVLKHEKTVHAGDSRTYVCSACGKSFRQKNLLKRHQNTHTEGRPHRCEVCEAAFKTRSTLAKHAQSHTATKRFPCTICDQQFRYKTSLKQHLNWHQGVKPFECQFCQKRFSQRGNMKEHLRVHSGDKPFSCGICDAHFTTSSQQRLHMMRHGNFRPHGCELCSKTFVALDAFKTHMRRHLNEKPFSCDDCPSSFAERNALRKHLRTHTREKPYACKHCEKTFSDLSNMARHTSKIHGRDKNLTEGSEAGEPTGNIEWEAVAQDTIADAIDDESDANPLRDTLSEVEMLGLDAVYMSEH
ncbi:gastrula zinc finger protein XlCGF57.1-like [Anopheles bellator]|uniref:gastrula zinc finger protein XlCGF57.1-like n=1 Tax=Anopheles bellator TaxID=139047 RepID=UPI00264A2AD1|nr:gastrula zinc finger protein XlCGF57.1-like [Anopheles bellator]